MKYCTNCGTHIDEQARFCPNCGHPINQPTAANKHESTFFAQLNKFIGNDGNAELNWRILFTNVLEKHTTEDAEEIFIVGTRKTTPSILEVSKDWPHPWLYSRVFLMFAIAFALLWLLCSMFHNPKALPGLIIVGSFTVPLTALILFLELNAWRNLSLYEIIKIFLVGGCASLVATSFLYSVLGSYGIKDYFGAFMTSLTEETGKAVIVYYFLRRLGKLSILSGMLVGSGVGAGFAAFESAGYAMENLMEGGWELMMDTILLRGYLAPGGHVAWAAISGAGLVIAAKSRGEISTSLLFDDKFLRLFVIPFVLHGLWDSPLIAIGIPHLISLMVFAWIVVLILINMGLAEVSKVQAHITIKDKE